MIEKRTKLNKKAKNKGKKALDLKSFNKQEREKKITYFGIIKVK